MKYPNKPYKYPIDIELSSKCTFKCVWCIHDKLEDRWWDLSVENIKKIINFININRSNIVYVWLAGFWEPLLNKNILLILDELINLKDIFLIIPTRWWKFLTNEILLKIQELRDKWIDISVQLWLYSLRKDIVNKMCWVDHYDDLINSIKRMKSLNFDFCLELLLTKNSKKEVPYFKKFCKSLDVDFIVHRLHNFWWKLDNYEDLYVEGDTDPYHNYNWMCWFKPFFTRNWKLTPWTFCWHYDLGWIDKYLFDWWMIKIIDDCYDTISLKNEYCKKCDDNILNARGKILESKK